MALIAELSIPAAELYVLRFCVTLSKFRIPIVALRYRPLLEFAQVEWHPANRAGHVQVLLDRDPISELTSTHFDLIQGCASGFGQLFVWFPPRAQPSGDECRLLIRAGVKLNFASQKIGVYI